MRRLAFCFGAVLALVFAPLLWLWATVPIVAWQEAKPADAAIIFGALVRSGQVSPLHAERLETGVALWQAGTVETLVLSNASRAAGIMAEFVEGQGVPSGAIELDRQAQSTPDTCVREADLGLSRSVILISQRYHLPRIALQCRRLGVTGQYVAAERAVRDDGASSLVTKLRVRSQRNTREALLVWAEVLGLYRELERALSP